MQDLIERQAAIDSICRTVCDNPEICESPCDEIKVLEIMPSAQPEPCEDTISRQAVYNVLDKMPVRGFKKDGETIHGLISLSQVNSAIINLPSVQPESLDEWCTDCKEYDHEKHCCPRWNRVIRQTLMDAQPEIIHCGECKHRDPEDHKCDCGHDIIWQLPRDDKWYCADAERRTDD